MSIVPHPLRVVRRTRELSLEALGEMAGVSPHTIVNVEQRHNAPRRSTMIALAVALQCDVAAISE
jgi:DNA-binding XRE family transcriptional regulator